jgi:glutaredoxin
MNRRAITYLTVTVAAALIGSAALFYYSNYSGSPVPGGYDEFARCLRDRGAVMYGTKTCPYCAKQKQMFGDSFRFIKYVECTAETQKCVADGVRRVPLWLFRDGRRLEGLQKLETLAAITGCPLPAASR